jgi:hypothetical protein
MSIKLATAKPLSGRIMAALFAVGMASLLVLASAAPVKAAQESGAIGIEGTIPSDPPTQGAVILTPSNGSTFTNIPITITGTCPVGLLVKVFKNNVFSGSAQCENGTFSVTSDLFSGSNELVARVYDALDQPGPDSNVVTVTYNDARPQAGPRVTLSSNFAKRGANPGETIIWPILLSGGNGPYAISVDWGDGTSPDLFTVEYPGEFKTQHAYKASGVYNIIVKATDKNGVSAFLQLVGVANGPLAQTDDSDDGTGATAKDTSSTGTSLTPQIRFILWPMYIMVPLIASTFWLGKRYELRRIRKKIEQGRNPF